jgi:glycine/D-amino acid oxidase-like deaminating enzyme
VKDTAQVVVIGSGAFGASTAYHLAAAGHRDVILVDAHDIASQTSPRAAGLTKQVRPDPDMTRLAMLSVQKIARFSEETGEPLLFVRSGSVNVARTERDEEIIRAEIAAGRSFGLEIDGADEGDLPNLAPLVRPGDIRAISHTPSDLYIEDPGELPRGYARAAERLGAAVLPHTRVTGIQTGRGRVLAVSTDRGTIRTSVVVDAAGAWTRLLGEQAGLRVPLVPARHQLYITGPIPGADASHPICRFYDAAVYMRPHQGGLLLGGYERDPQLYDMSAVPEHFQVRDVPLDMGVLERLTDLVRGQIRLPRDVPIREHRGGLPTMTPDGRPILGPIPGLDGFVIASGCCVGGLSLSPAIGQVLAELIHGGRPSLALDAFSISRFAGEYEAEHMLRDACRQEYANFYASTPRGQAH